MRFEEELAAPAGPYWTTLLAVCSTDISEQALQVAMAWGN
jgi:hypothetical protein